MDEKTFEEKVDKDVTTVFEDGQNSLQRLAQSADKVKENLTTWAEDSAAQLNQKLTDLKSDAKDKVAVTVRSIEQDVDQGLNDYNGKIQKFADQIPGGFSRKITRYPWVTISISLVIGLLLGFILKPTRRF